MKILEANAGPLTNFEVLDFLRSKGAAKDPTRVLAKVLPSEYKVFDYLNQTPACNQTREAVIAFVEKSKEYDLAKAEILNIINLRPITPVELFPIIENCDVRMGEEATERMEEMGSMVEHVFPTPQIQPTFEATPNEGNEAETMEEQEGAGDAVEEPIQTT
ncbi:DNA-directed RNA polymerase III subunit RPC9-like [Cucumis melo var. makuwa]|uniref:DNA-directed RNA polymerase III subunit RPC9 n=1 Tax=Cucumis melo var. makuwa TaxID=1194695 RepID=A0A5A7UV88_CUCMM|nr:DNA-directed RNA polymerase III subunit RPC9-like [Cucumis melo var. makuwa]TYK30148.1 DNA-directed RNA polymerase III subunit RPC9-like [Cucumis melo var. makuwa]